MHYPDCRGVSRNTIYYAGSNFNHGGYVEKRQSNLIGLDFGRKLEITINNERPVVLTDLTMALLGVGQQYQRFIENEMHGQPEAVSELFVKEVRSGSIIVELIAQAVAVAPLLWEGGSLVEWAKQCQRVSYSSQSGDLIDRTWRKQQKLEARLGANWTRPKGHEAFDA